MGRFVWAVAVFVLLAGLYLFLAGNVDAVEVTAMVVCAAAGTALAVALERVAKRNYSSLPPLKAVVRPFAALLPETFVVGRDLAGIAITGTRRQRGDFVQQPFNPGGDDSRSAARRALTVIGLSLAPRAFVVRGDRTDAVLLHELPPKPTSADTAWPA